MSKRKLQPTVPPAVDLNSQLQSAIRHFWATRNQQSVGQGAGRAKARDRGARAAVTGGKQMDEFIALIRTLLLNAGVPSESIHTNSKLELPGWFRAEKKWDLIVVHRNQLLAAIEFKSQVGPSFGNNFNNRTEESLGSASDIWAAYREGAFKPSLRPWLGYFMLLEDCPASRRPIGISEPNFPVFPEFNGASYQSRYRILIQKLVRERLYDGACFLLADASQVESGTFIEPDPELQFSGFVSAMTGQVQAAVSRCDATPA